MSAVILVKTTQIGCVKIKIIMKRVVSFIRLKLLVCSFIMLMPSMTVRAQSGFEAFIGTSLLNPAIIPDTLFETHCQIKLNGFSTGDFDSISVSIFQSDSSTVVDDLLIPFTDGTRVVMINESAYSIRIGNMPIGTYVFRFRLLNSLGIAIGDERWVFYHIN